MNKRRNEMTKDRDLTSSSSKKLCITNETEEALNNMSLLFPEDKFGYRLPRIVMKHMLYSCITDQNRTKGIKHVLLFAQ